MSTIPSHKGHHAREGQSRQAAFTIVELLIVIVVIGILAAITIVAFNGIQNRALNTSVESDLKNAAKRLELYKVDAATNAYPANSTDLTGIGIKFNQASYKTGVNNIYYCATSDQSRYVIAVLVKNDVKYFLIDGQISVGTGTSLSGNQTCQQIGISSGGSFYTGYLPAMTPSWQAWTQ